MPKDDGGKRLHAQFEKVWNVAEELRVQLVKKSGAQVLQRDREFDKWVGDITSTAKKLQAIRKVVQVLYRKMDAHPTAWKHDHHD